MAMAAQRAVAPLASTSNLLIKFASPPGTYFTLSWRHALRSFSSLQPTQMSAKRKIQTSSAYHPSSLGLNLPSPPRNVGVPDTSIAGAMPQVNDTRPPRMTSGEAQVFGLNQAKQPSTITTEQEAQKSKPVNTPTSTNPITNSTQSKAKTRPRLRARKATMNLTTKAVDRLRAMLDQPEPKLIKVGVRNRGCSGLAYHLEYVEKPGIFDEMVEQDGVKVLVDSKALFSIIGSEMDWVEDKLNQRFVFKNPNIKEQCGCGESFMV